MVTDIIILSVIIALVAFAFIHAFVRTVQEGRIYNVVKELDSQIRWDFAEGRLHESLDYVQFEKEVENELTYRMFQLGYEKKFEYDVADFFYDLKRNSDAARHFSRVG